MRGTKLVSVRLDEENLRTIDDAARKDAWRKRSDYVNAAIRFMAWAIEHKEKEKLLKFFPEYGDVVDEFTMSYHRQHK